MTDGLASPRTAYIGLGANLGDARGTLQAAVQALAALPASRLDAVSPVYRSAPIEANGPDFFNAVARIETALAPLDLLEALQAIEQRHGRERPYPNAPRTLDLDLLLLGDTRMQSDCLTLPHPRMHRRAFVLRPLLDLDAALQLPGLGSARELLPALSDQRIEKDIP